MSSTIKFRAWDKIYKHFHEQDLIRDYILGDFIDNFEYEVTQYSELKDVNGAEIFEGDIVSTHNQNNVIKKMHGSFMVVGLHKDVYERTYCDLRRYLVDATIPSQKDSKFDGITTTLEIIGNIYENPELLTK